MKTITVNTQKRGLDTIYENSEGWWIQTRKGTVGPFNTSSSAYSYARIRIENTKGK